MKCGKKIEINHGKMCSNKGLKKKWWRKHIFNGRQLNSSLRNYFEVDEERNGKDVLLTDLHRKQFPFLFFVRCAWNCECVINVKNKLFNRNSLLLVFILSFFFSLFVVFASRQCWLRKIKLNKLKFTSLPFIILW